MAGAWGYLLVARRCPPPSVLCTFTETWRHLCRSRPRSRPSSILGATACPRRPARPPARLAFGGDYNPEQWPRGGVAGGRTADARGRRHDGQRSASSPGRGSRPGPASTTSSWLDRAHRPARTRPASASTWRPRPSSPPAWFYRAHPEALPVTPGGRAAASSAHAARSATPTPTTGRAAADHPRTRRALRPSSGARDVARPQRVRRARARAATATPAPRTSGAWLAGPLRHARRPQRGLGHRLLGPALRRLGRDRRAAAATPTVGNPAQHAGLQAVRRRDQARENFVAERDILHRLSPGIPVTTNFMVAPSQCDSIDYWAWGREVDLVTNDHYLITDGRRTHVNLAIAADLTRSVGGRRPLAAPRTLHRRASTGSRATPPRPRARWPATPSAHVARGSEGALFFQWRQSRARRGEVPLGDAAARPGRGRRVWREVIDLGRRIARPGGPPRYPHRRRRGHGLGLALLVGAELEWRPSEDPGRPRAADAFYEALYDRHLTVDFVAPREGRGRSLAVPAGRRPRAVPGARRGRRTTCERYVANGGTLVVSYFSGIVDEHDAVHPGPVPGRAAGRTRPDRRGVRRRCCRASGPRTGPDGAGLDGRRVDRVRRRRAAPRPWTLRRRARRPAARPSPGTALGDGRRLVRVHPPRPRTVWTRCSTWRRRRTRASPPRRPAPRRRTRRTRGRVGLLPVRHQPHRARREGGAGHARHRTAHRRTRGGPPRRARRSRPGRTTRRLTTPEHRPDAYETPGRNGGAAPTAFGCGTATAHVATGSPPSSKGRRCSTRDAPSGPC